MKGRVCEKKRDDGEKMRRKMERLVNNGCVESEG